MSTKDLAAQYGKSKNAKQLVNLAIRAECPGGAEALDALDKIRTLHEGCALPETGQSLIAVRAIVAAMAAEIRRRYGMPAQDD